jgi:hypothetical protein
MGAVDGAYSPPRDRPRRRTIPYIAAGVFLALFAMKISAYVAPHAVRPAAIGHVVFGVENSVRTRLRNTAFLHSCAPPQRKLTISGGWLCAAPLAARDAYGKVFETYPASANGRDYVYKSTTVGTLASARALMNGSVEIPRYAPFAIGVLPTWSEDPYHSVYWRMNFYALRPTENLLKAYVKTGDERYAKRLMAIDLSFFKHESTSPHAWEDDHAVAFRAMVLVHEWWQLRYYHQLTEAQSSRFLRELEKTGQFLADVNHYQPEHNHGTNEAAALLELAVDFPTLPHAKKWGAIARARLAAGIVTLVDGDGALIENSPYYDFYTLDKYWQIYEFSQRTNFVVAKDLAQRIRKMIEYATYVLQPDSSVPLLGASLKAVIHDAGSYRAMAKLDPHFKYVLTHGEEGKKPPLTSVFFPYTGQTIMRSGWGKGQAFVGQSYLTFNVGPYRTAHSNLDALAITLYGGGMPLLPGAGLYTYSPGVMRNYFHGTASHDTVVVDHRSQSQGTAVAGTFAQKAGVTYQTGESSLYEGVDHRRLVMMVDKKHVIVLDRLTSSETHVYDQMFHLFAGAHVTRSGLTVSGHGSTPAQSIAIRQLASSPTTVSLTTGQKDPPAGLCSESYQQAIPCTSVQYEQRGRDVTFATLLTIGRPDPSFRLSYRPEEIRVRTPDRTLEIHLGETGTVEEVATASDPTPPEVNALKVPGTDASRWQATGAGRVSLTAAAGSRGGAPTVVALTTSGTDPALLSARGLDADLTGRNLLITLKVSSVDDLGALDLQLSNDNWTTTNSIDLRRAYPARYDGETVTLSLGRGGSSVADPDIWTTTGDGRFDWSRIDGIRLFAEARDTLRPPVTISVRSIETTAAQQHAAIVFIFDDGYDSVLPAARYLHAHGMPGDIAAIGKYIELPTQGHLSLADLHQLQDNWGWNIVNHTQSHVDATLAYNHPRRFQAYAHDILAGAQFLQRSGLDSASNWFIYPHGTTNAALDRVVGRYYKFARVTYDGPEAFPFGEPLRVKSLEVHNPGDSEGNTTGAFTMPGEVQRAVLNAKRYHLTLILTFHRIHSRPSDRPGYPLDNFKKIVDGIQKAGVRVTTLSGLDAMMGVPEDNHIDIHPGSPSQLSVSIRGSEKRHGLLTRLWDAL